MSTPLVSVIMPSHNRASIVGRAITSVISQTLAQWELIIVDDGSTDDTPQIIADYQAADARIRGIRLDPSEGAPSARNRGIAAARGEYVAFIDDDDEWFASKLEHQVAVFATATASVGLVHSAFIEVEDGRDQRLVNALVQSDGIALEPLLCGNRLGHSTVIARKSLLDHVRGFDSALPRLQDWDLWIRLAMVTRFACVADPLVRIHLTPASISSNRNSLREACDYLVAKYAQHNGLTRRQYAELCYAVGQLLMRHGFTARGRVLIGLSLRLHPWPLTRIGGALLSLMGHRPYLAAVRLHARGRDLAEGRRRDDLPPTATR